MRFRSIRASTPVFGHRTFPETPGIAALHPGYGFAEAIGSGYFHREVDGREHRESPISPAALRGFGPVGIVAILLIVLSGNAFVGDVVIPIGAMLVLLWASWSRTPWRDIGYVRSKHWVAILILGIALGVALKLVMKAIVMPLLGADPINQAYHHLAGNRSLLPAAVWAMLVAGFAEETVFRGYLFERFGKLLGTGTGAKITIVSITSVWFGISHYADQGLAGAEQATIVGLVFGTIYAVTQRIWLPMVAHAAFDLTALAIIYWDVETEVARFFR